MVLQIFRPFACTGNASTVGRTCFTTSGERMSLAIDQGSDDVVLINDTIDNVLRETVDRFPERDALVAPHQGIRQNWTEFAETVDDVAKGLMGLGVEVGDRVAMWSPNYAEWIYIQFATAKIGAIQVNVNPAYRTSELEYALNQSGARILVTRTSYLTSEYQVIAEQVAPNVPSLERVIYFDTDDWAELLAAGADVTNEALSTRAASLHPDDAINIQYTSGTTGFPKGATLSHVNILNNANSVGSQCAYDHTDRVCIPVPFYHCFGMVMGNLACAVYGSAMVIPCPTFDPAAVLRTIEEERCTSLYGVPTMFIAQLGDDSIASTDLSSLRTGIMAGSPCPIEVMRRVIDEMNMSEVTIAYGQTETSPVSTQTSTTDPVEVRVSTVGQVLPHVEAKIINPESGEVVARGESGEYCTRGPHVMIGYWEDSEKTAEAIDEDGWMHSGDLATMDEAGYVNIVGRIKDLIIRGGENVYPREIEEFLFTHPEISDAQVIGVPDAKYGEEIAAWVQLESGAQLDEEQLREWCRGKIAHFKIPRYVSFVTDFPMTVTGKVRKVEMREKTVADLGLQGVETETA